MAYIVWPLAIYSRFVPRPDSTGWLKFHVNQALWFGNLTVIAALIALSWPLVITALIGNVVATIWLYVLAIVLDGALFVLWLVLALRYSQQAGRGELFDVPYVSRITGTAPKK